MKRVVPIVVVLLLLVCPFCPRARAQGGAAVGGVVRDLHGAPQMGALVELLSGDATVVARTFTDDRGRYLLASVTPGRYALRASAAFLLPVMRTNLHLGNGVQALANLTMTTVFEVGQWFPATKRSADEPSDDWRWTLRSTANRPILRLDTGAGEKVTPVPVEEQPLTGTVHGSFVLAAREGTFAEGGTHQELHLERPAVGGTSETLAADVGEPGLSGGASAVSVAVGYERHSAMAGDSRIVASVQSHPEISSPGGVGLQAVTLATSEQFALGNAVMIDAGTLLTAERLVESRAQAAPYIRIVVSPAAHFAFLYRFAAGRDLQCAEDAGELQLSPEAMGDAEGRPVSLKNTHQELAASHHGGGDTESVLIYQDQVPVEALNGIGNSPENVAGLPVLADESTGTFRVAVSGYVARGMSVSWMHTITPALVGSLQAAVGSALVRGEEPLLLGNLRAGVHAGIEPALTAALQGKINRSGTEFRAQYRWQPSTTMDAVNAFNTAPDDAYLGVSLRQRLWSGHRLQGMDAVLAATNLLEEGYQPVVGTDGHTLFLAQAPRALQAGIAFSF